MDEPPRPPSPPLAAPTPAAPTLDEDEVHVWRLDLASDSVGDANQLLSDDERAQAARFRFDRDRDRFTECRARLRQILGLYLERPAESIRLDRGPYGKPFRRRGDGERDIRFNVSHSQGEALIAVALGREVGVDLEHLGTKADPLQIAAQFFTPAERAFVERHPPDERMKAFLACWTRKEAWMKGAGVGLSQPPDRFDVACTLRSPAISARLESIESDWLIFDLHPSSDTIGAVAAEARGPCRWRYISDEFDLRGLPAFSAGRDLIQ